MMEGALAKAHRRKVQDLNIVPILDMLTTVIFFLLLSTSFLEYVKLTVPPSAVTSVAATEAPPPVAPKMLLVPWNDGLRLILTWSGERGGERSTMIRGRDPGRQRSEIIEASSRMAREFALAFPKERTLQVAMGRRVPFQDLISLMDGIREAVPDVVLISPAEAEARANANPPREPGA